MVLKSPLIRAALQSYTVTYYNFQPYFDDLDQYDFSTLPDWFDENLVKTFIIDFFLVKAFCYLLQGILFDAVVFVDELMGCYKIEDRIVGIDDVDAMEQMAEDKVKNKTLYAGIF